MTWARADSVFELRGRYGAFLVDQFGTLHDGATVYPGAGAALRALRDAGARVALLSNSGKRAAANAARLTRLGIPQDAYDLFVTSGEVAWQMLCSGALPGATRALVLERGGTTDFLDGLGIAAVADAPDVVVIAGSDGDTRTLDSYRVQLGPYAAANIPALCTNPDRTMLTASGPAFGAGRIAEAYGAMGGNVTWIGKPHRAIYDHTFAALGVAPADCAGIGDSAEHDIAGAHAAGAAGWLVRTGLLDGADDAAVDAECARFGARPDGVLRTFG